MLIIGYMVFYTVDVEAHIMNLAVNPAERKQGYARQLLDHALNVFQRKRASPNVIWKSENTTEMRKGFTSILVLK